MRFRVKGESIGLDSNAWAFIMIVDYGCWLIDTIKSSDIVITGSNLVFFKYSNFCIPNVCQSIFLTNNFIDIATQECKLIEIMWLTIAVTLKERQQTQMCKSKINKKLCEK